jgi:hypothetical protein
MKSVSEEILGLIYKLVEQQSSIQMFQALRKGIGPYKDIQEQLSQIRKDLGDQLKETSIDDASENTTEDMKSHMSTDER